MSDGTRGGADPARTARCSRARRSARSTPGTWRPARSCSTPRSPATRRSSPTRATRARSSRSRTRTSATTAPTPTTTRAAAPFCRGVDRARPRPPAEQLARRPSRSPTFLARHGVPGDRRHRHPPAHPPPARPRRGARRVRHRRGRGARAAAASRRRPTASTSSRPSRPTTRLHRRRSRRAVPRRRVRLRDQAHDPAPPRPAPAASWRSSRPRPRRPTCSSRQPDGVFLSNGPGDPAAVVGDDRRGPRARGHRRPALRHLPRPPDPRLRRSAAATVKLPFGHHGGEPPGPPRADRPGRDHEPEPQLRGRSRRARPRRRDHARQPQRRRVRGAARARRAGVLGAAPSRGRARSARRRVPVRRVHDADGRER